MSSKREKRTEVEASKNAKRVAKTTANRERNRKEMHTKRKELRNNVSTIKKDLNEEKFTEMPKKQH